MNTELPNQEGVVSAEIVEIPAGVDRLMVLAEFTADKVSGEGEAMYDRKYE